MLYPLSYGRRSKTGSQSSVPLRCSASVPWGRAECRCRTGLLGLGEALFRPGLTGRAAGADSYRPQQHGPATPGSVAREVVDGHPGQTYDTRPRTGRPADRLSSTGQCSSTAADSAS